VTKKPEIAPLALEGFLPYRLNRIADIVSRKFSAIYRDRHGMTRPEWRTLATLGQYGSATATGIVRHSSMHKTKVSRAIGALEARGWLKRMPDETDRRVEHLTLTSQGNKVYLELVPLAKAFEAELLGRVSAQQRAALLEGLSALEQSAGMDPGGAGL
jgi:DNA-binding MarR family transcriptional regulator